MAIWQPGIQRLLGCPGLPSDLVCMQHTRLADRGGVPATFLFDKPLRIRSSAVLKDMGGFLQGFLLRSDQSQIPSIFQDVCEEDLWNTARQYIAQYPDQLDVWGDGRDLRQVFESYRAAKETGWDLRLRNPDSLSNGSDATQRLLSAAQIEYLTAVTLDYLVPRYPGTGR